MEKLVVETIGGFEAYLEPACVVDVDSPSEVGKLSDGGFDSYSKSVDGVADIEMVFEREAEDETHVASETRG